MTGNYVAQLLDRIEARPIPPGRFADVNILHDGWCEIFKGGQCNCNPIVEEPQMRAEQQEKKPTITSI
jgi:hypothetical protein